MTNSRNTRESSIVTNSRRLALHPPGWKNIVKGCEKKTVISKIEGGFLMGTVCPRRLFFSGFGVLMRTLNLEKDNLRGLSVPNNRRYFASGR